MSQTEIYAILDHPMTAKQIARAVKLPTQTTKGNLTRMRKNQSVAVVGQINRELIYVRSN